MTDETPQTSFDVVAEIKNAVAIIDHASEQGAFRGWAVVNQVLAVRGRLVAFIEMMEVALKTQADLAAAENPPSDETEASASDEDLSEATTEAVVVESNDAELPAPEEEISSVDALRHQYAEAMATLEALRKQIDDQSV